MDTEVDRSKIPTIRMWAFDTISRLNPSDRCEEVIESDAAWLVHWVLTGETRDFVMMEAKKDETSHG